MNPKLAVLAMAMAGVAAPLFAHHSFSAEFDGSKNVKLDGTVTKVEFMNPHVWIYLDVKGDNGSVAHWQCEGGAPNGLYRNGWTKDSLKKGDEITVEGALSKDGSRTCNARVVKLADGRSVFAGSSGGDAAAAGSRYVNPATVGK